MFGIISNIPLTASTGNLLPSLSKQLGAHCRLFQARSATTLSNWNILTFILLLHAGFMNRVGMAMCWMCTGDLHAFQLHGLRNRWKGRVLAAAMGIVLDLFLAAHVVYFSVCMTVCETLFVRSCNLFQSCFQFTHAPSSDLFLFVFSVSSSLQVSRILCWL